MDFYLQQKNAQVKVVFDNAIDHMRALYKAGKNVKISISENRDKKTDQQRKYAHACISIIAKEIGYEPDRLKIDIKVKLGLIEKIYVSGEILTRVKSTEDLDVEQYGKFINAIVQLAGQMDIKLPQTREFGYE